jgi:chemotaxis methyl-accepting protein methylase
MREDAFQVEGLAPAEVTAFNNIISFLHRECGVDFRLYRPNCLLRRISARRHDTHQDSLAAYVTYLASHPEECRLLCDRITINVSEFFRNQETFAAVARCVIPDMESHKQKLGSRVLRVWSAGCATGEEPYSLAMLLDETLTRRGSRLSWKIFATDIDREAMRIAQAGLYQKRQLKGVSLQRLKTYFTLTPDGAYTIHPALAGQVKFSRHNMISDPPLTNIDIIFCRNVVIYFSRELQQRVYENFYQALAPGGYLVAGKVETLVGAGETLFERVDVGERIFRKTSFSA